MGPTKTEVDELLRKFDETGDVNLADAAVTRADAAELPATAPKADALAFRTEKLRALLAIFNHLDARLIPGFDFDDLPPMTAAPPPETGLPPGVDPASIKDPKARADYERAIAANQAKMKAYGYQLKLHRVDQGCADAVERLIIGQYPKSSTPEVNRQIDETVRSPGRRAALKERLSAAVGERR